MSETNTYRYLLQPDYYQDYYCLANECPDTCCKGWNIEIDPEHMEYWQKYVPELVEAVPFGKNKLRYRVRLNKEMICPLLREDGLCSLVLKHGHEATTQICQDFPRMKYDYEDILQKNVVIRCAYVLELLWKKGKFSYLSLDMDGNPAQVSFPVKEMMDGLLEIGNEGKFSTAEFLAAMFDSFYQMHLRLEPLTPCDENGYKEYGQEMIDSDNTKEVLAWIRGWKEKSSLPQGSPISGLTSGSVRKLKQAAAPSVPLGLLLKGGENLQSYQDMMYELVKSFYENPAFGPDFTNTLEASRRLVQSVTEEQLICFLSGSFITADMDRKLTLMVVEEIYNSLCSVEMLDYQTLLVRLQWLIVQYAVIRYIIFLDICQGKEITDDLLQFRISRIFRVTDLPDILRISYFDTGFLNWLWTPEHVKEVLQIR